MKTHFWFAIVVVFLFMLSALAQQAGSSPAAGTAQIAPPPLIQFSGLATDEGGTPFSGTVRMTFALYPTRQDGEPLWTETQNLQVDATGHYSVQLGITKPYGVPAALFSTGEPRWLGVRIAGEEEQPRILLVSVPYALKAGDAATLGGLPPSAFLLATPGNANGAAASQVASPDAATPLASGPVTGTGTVGYLPLWDTTSDIISSVLFQSGSGATARIGIGTSTPASTLDVKGNTTLRGGTWVQGTLTLQATGTATASTGKNSQPLALSASAFNSGTNAAATQTFELQTEPVANDTATPSGTLNLLYGSGTTKPAETGLKIGSNGQITFAAGQAFPGTGTLTGVTTAAGSGLMGGGTAGTLNLGLTNACATNQVLHWTGTAWACATPGLGTITGVTAGTDLTGGGATGTVTLNLDTTKVPLLGTANTFTGNQTVNGNLSATGVVTGSSFQIGSTLFAFGSLANGNSFLGFAGNSTTTGINNTASGGSALQANTMGVDNTAAGFQALNSNTTGGWNTATGVIALWLNTTGIDNTATGVQALNSNTTGNNNAASGYQALYYNTTGSNNSAIGTGAGNTSNATPTTGSNNTFVGANSGPGTQTTLSNASAIGANAEVTASNALVLGSINGVNGATASTNVGIGTTAPAYALDVHGTGNFTGPVTFASGQVFPGTGTVTSVASGSGLTGGPITGSGTLSIATGGVTNTMLANPSLTVTAGNGLTGGGAVSLGGSTALGVDFGMIPRLSSPNLFSSPLEVIESGASAPVLGQNTATTGTVIGVEGITNSSAGYGVYGYAPSSSGNAIGVYGASLATNGTGVLGANSATSGTTFGVIGSTQSPSGTGMYGSGTTGVEGATTSSTGVGVLGVTGSSGINYGVEGVTYSPNGFGVYGAAGAGGYGVYSSGPMGVNGNLSVTGNQTVLGNLTTNGTLTGGVVNASASFDLAGAPVLYGSNNDANVFLGFGNAGNPTAGTFNTAVGSDVMYGLSTGGSNSAFGDAALVGVNAGSNNTAVGAAALGNTSSSNNTAVGIDAGKINQTGQYNTYIGSYAGSVSGPLTSLSYSAAIGANSSVSASNAMVLGAPGSVSSAVGQVNVGIGTSAPAYRLDVSYGDMILRGLTAFNTSGQVANLYVGDNVHGMQAVNGQGTYILSCCNPNALFVQDGGNVGVGTNSPTNRFTVAQGAGPALADGWATYSSRRWKTNIQTLHGALAKVEQLRGVSYDLKNSGKHEIGVIAEEVGSIVPEVVTYEDNGKDARGVDYTRLTALLIEATKEQQVLIQMQRAQIEAQQKELLRLAAQVRAIRTSLQTRGGTGPDVRTVTQTGNAIKSRVSKVRPERGSGF